MKLADFDYELPAERIAQHPSPRRDRSRLLVVGGDGDEDRRFDALPELLRAGDLLVLNDTRILKVEMSIALLRTKRAGSNRAPSHPMANG